MKKVILTITIMVFATITSIAQEVNTPGKNRNKGVKYKNSIRTTPLSILGGEIGVSYERVLKPKISLNSLLAFNYNEYDLNSKVSMDEYRVFLETEIRYYLSRHKNAPDGWFTSGGGLANYSYFIYTGPPLLQDRDFNILQIGGVIKMGYQWIFKRGFTIGSSGGVDYLTSVSNIKGADGLGYRLEFSIGYSW
ncbi:DUF3575 domain-containing protein [Aquimarina sp. RZ0]|uniref:DUF3575 domain-containing protein n=1 Tax=Aquimarina sp. RZ0 TaxID=2607730 RepID=UPI0011F0CC5E|nr:DUF3575 domain-containing protein [Aquimarina sp. RZ0]KAA1246846.1 DUF3575 domain-containing protein [Aquimarina sp. RZ0]